MRFFMSLAILLFVDFGFAHSLHLVAQYDGQNISGKAYYSDMTPAAQTYVEAYREGEDKPAVEGQTNDQGYFQLALVSDKPLKVVVEGEEGHRSSTLVEKLALNTPSGGNEFAQLRTDIAQLGDKIYLQNILGGVGYILGIIGIFAWFKARKET